MKIAFPLFVLFILAADARGQYDPNCYFPKLGEPGVIDSIYGSENNQMLSSYNNIGPGPDGLNGRMLFIGLPSTPPFLSAIVPTGPGFDLHNLTSTGTTLPQFLNGNIRTGHFRSPNYIDILDPTNLVIYLEDENGNYDSTRSTKLKSNFLGDSVFYVPGDMTPYVAKLSQDSVDDIVFGIGIYFPQLNSGNVFLVCYREERNYTRKAQLLTQIARYSFRNITRPTSIGATSRRATFVEQAETT